MELTIYSDPPISRHGSMQSSGTDSDVEV